MNLADIADIGIAREAADDAERDELPTRAACIRVCADSAEMATALLASLEAVLPLVKHTDDAGWDVMKKARAIVEKANGR